MEVEYVVAFDYPEGPVVYAGLYKGALGFAPTVRTALRFPKEGAENIKENGYGELGKKFGRVVPLNEVEK